MFNSSVVYLKCRKCIVIFGLAVFVIILIFGNFKSPAFYANLKATKEEMLRNESYGQRVQLLKIKNNKTTDCEVIKCRITCSGDMTAVKNFLESQKTCTSIALSITHGVFPNKTIHSNWLLGRYNLSYIKISRTELDAIENGAFNHETVEFVLELELDNVHIMSLTEQTFVGLKSIETFTLINKIDVFVGDSFLKSMMSSLKKIVIRHETSIATDPGPWLRGENFPRLNTIVFDGSNFGGYINVLTFQHLKELIVLLMKSCQISHVADGAFDFMMKHMLVHISLNSNRLKRIEGEYISKTTSLRRIDIQNNPWECTCELENLVREFKAYPGGFGENSKCSSPPDKIGKLLSQIDLEPCDSEERYSSTTETAIQTNFETTSTNSTTPSPQNRTTTISDDTIFIECTRHKVEFSTYPSTFLELAAPDGYFEITQISDSSARLSFESLSDDLAVIWFCEQPQLYGKGNDVRIIGEFHVGCQSEFDTSLIVEGLFANTIYPFCLIKNGTQFISPFNCQSYISSLKEFSNNSNTTWLDKKDKPLAISVFVVSVFVSLCLGLGGMFLLILHQPCLIKGNKRIIFINKTSITDCRNARRNNARSVGSSFGNRFDSQTTTAQLRRFSSDSGLSYMMANNYEDLEYHSRMNIYNQAPKSPAPPLPNRISDDGSKQIKSLDKSIHVAEEEVYDYGYTSVA